MTRLVCSKILTENIYKIDQTQEDLKFELDQNWQDEKDKSFKEMLENHIMFYEETMKQQLIKKTIKYQETIRALAKYLNLKSIDSLFETIKTLVQFAKLHTEYAEEVIEEKRVKVENKKALKMISTRDTLP